VDAFQGGRLTVAIPITRPILGPEEHQAVADVLSSGFLVQGRRVTEFEELVATRIGSKHGIAVTNCTAALHLALLALEIGPGDKVVVAPYSWVATANVIELVGATPVFVDIDADTFNMDANQLEAALVADANAGSIKAIMPVHTFGNTHGIDDLASLGERFHTPLIEDAACALGATSGLRAAGSIGTIGCFSFHPRKIITTGEGGMLITDDDRLAAFARAYRNHGQELVNGSVEFVIAGGNLRITEMQGALGVTQMSRLDMFLEQRNSLSLRYDALLMRSGMTPQLRAIGAAVQSYVALVPQGRTAQPVIEQLRAQGIEATIGTNAIPFTKHFQSTMGITPSDLPNVATVAARAVTLPLFPGMSIEEQDSVIRAVEHALS
jgi:perosamine synthetase